MLPGYALIDIQRTILAFKGVWTVAFVVAREVGTPGVILTVRCVGNGHLLIKSRYNGEHKLGCCVRALINVSAFRLVTNVVEVAIEIAF